MTQPTGLPRYSDKAGVKALCDWMVKKADSLDFKVGSRGWLYLLENAGIIDKTQFEPALSLIGKCRKGGELPLWVVAEDEARRLSCLEYLDNEDPDQEVADIISSINDRIDLYQPFSFWDDLPVFLAMMVEKSDLKSLFEPVCRKYFVPIGNARGWSDINLRVNLMRLFRRHEAQGRQCILMYAGDFDPAGLSISDRLEKNFKDLEKAVGWNPSNLIIDRFGLNYDFIEEHKLPWIENLKTSSGKDLAKDPEKHGKKDGHPNHHLAYVQDYLYRYGARKCEANALVVRPEAGRKLCEDAIVENIYGSFGAEVPIFSSTVKADLLKGHDQMLAEPREELKAKVKAELKLWAGQG